MINRIRIGNDINIEFTILINKEKADISDAKNITVNVFREENVNDSVELTALNISSNPIKFTITGNLEHKSGLYRALITYNKSNVIDGEPDIYYAVDAPVFKLVSWSGQQQIGNEIPVIIPPLLIEGLILQVGSSGGGSGKDGITPHIGENKNWWIGNIDTNIRAEGINGLDGKDGKDGLDGKDGKDGNDGEPGTTIHSKLSDLGFKESGHMGFASEESVHQLVDEVNSKAPINSPDFTGIPTTPTPDIINRTLQIANTTFVKSVVSEHDKDVSAHNEIKTELISQIETARKIAEGANRAEAFDTIETMQIWLTSPINVAKLRIGDLFLIRQVDAPDFWWDGYKPLELEAKLDLSDYYTKTIIDAKFQNNETQFAALDNYMDQLLAAYYDNGERIVVLENELLGSAGILTRIEGRL